MAYSLVADIGGTSSRWALLPEQGDPKFFERLPGFNPAVGEPDAMITALRKLCAADQRVAQAAEVNVYGAGCGSEERARRMQDVLLGLWKEARITVRSDLLGAAIGLCGERAGLVLVLGTGMNVGFFDGATLRLPLPSLGFVLGDEGSGADLGRALLRDALYQAIPTDVAAAIFPTAVDVHDVVRNVYRTASPQAYLASFAALLSAHAEASYVRDLVESRFAALAELIERFFPSAERSAVHATGSIALAFQDLLGSCLAERGMRLTSVERDPLPGLVRHHRQRWP